MLHLTGVHKEHQLTEAIKKGTSITNGDYMSQKFTSVLTAAVVSGLMVSSIAHAEGSKAESKDATMSADKNRCKGKMADDKNSCKGKVVKKNKKNDKNSCKNGCGEAKEKTEGSKVEEKKDK